MDELEQIQAQIAELQKKAEEITNQKKSAVIEDMKSKINAYGITAKDLGFGFGDKVAKGATTSKPVAIKYKQGDKTWTGRGRQPKWVVEHLEGGGKIEDLLV